MMRKMIGSTYTERWLVIDAYREGRCRQHHLQLQSARPRVELPAVGDRVRWEFMQLPGEDDGILKAGQDPAYARDRAYEIPGFRNRRKAVYTFRTRRQQMALPCVPGGRSAHLMPPFAGRGANGGIRTPPNIAWKLAAV